MKQKTAAKLTTMFLTALLIQADLTNPQLRTSASDICVTNHIEFFDPGKLDLVRNQVDRTRIPEVIPIEHRSPDETRHYKTLEGNKEIRKMLEPAPYTAEEQLLAQLVEAEAGTQGMRGKRLVADVVLNRVDSSIFPNSIHDVIFQKYQFSVIFDGRFDRMANRITKESLEAARKELAGPRIDSRILYFNSGSYCMNGSNPWKYKDHWFAY